MAINHSPFAPQSFKPNYMSDPAKAVYTTLKTGPQGLSTIEVSHRLRQFGPNSLIVDRSYQALKEFLNNFTDPLIIILMGIVFLAFIFGQTLNGVIVLTMVILSVTLNFFQEYRASQAAEKLKKRVAIHATVLRDGQEVSINVAHLVPGDIVILNAGDIVPADARLTEATDLHLNQATLTGESIPVNKTAGAVKDTEPLNALNLIFAGTTVVTGTGKAAIFATGMATQLGHIAQSLKNPVSPDSFSQGLGRLATTISRLVIIFTITIFLLNYLLKGDVVQSFTFAIAMAVGLTPEFLAMILSVTMGQGAVHMAKQGVIVKKLRAIPTFGSMDVLCTDKTGTLTRDHIELVKYVNYAGEHSDLVLKHAYLNAHFQTGINNPLDEAVKKHAHESIGSYKKLAEIPFDFERKKLSVVVEKSDHSWLITKGAPEDLLPCCTHNGDPDHPKPFTASTIKVAQNTYDTLSADGLRVLAVATKKVTSDDAPYNQADESDLTFLGFTAFLDPVKAHVRQALDALEDRHVEIKVITGDNELVAHKICREAGIQIKGIMAGHDLVNLSEKDLQSKVETTTLFARFSPDQKNRVIQALRLNGHVVGYLGDGINDAPSLLSADVGISVANAVDVAKEAADFILTQKNLELLADGVTAGRTVFVNTLKYLQMGLSSNLGNMISMYGAVIFLPFLPMLPVQILLNNFLYDLSQITIPTDHVDPEQLVLPLRWDLPGLVRYMFTIGPISTLYDFLTFAVLYYYYHAQPQIFQTGWFMASLATQVLVIHVIRTKKIPFIGSTASLPLLLSSILVVIIGWTIPFLRLGSVFSFSPPSATVIMLLCCITFLYLATTFLVRCLTPTLTKTTV